MKYLKNNTNERFLGYKEGWEDAQAQVNWEMKSLTDENSRLKIENQYLKKTINNIGAILI